MPGRIAGRGTGQVRARGATDAAVLRQAYVKRGKTDAIGAEAICEAVTRPGMRFVPVKTKDRQAMLLAHRTRDFLVRQMIQVTNAIRAVAGLTRPPGATVPAPLAEFGRVAPKGIHNAERLLALAGEVALPEPARPLILLLAEQFRDTHKRIAEITVQIKTQAQTDAVARRLQTIPGIGGDHRERDCRQRARCVELQSGA